MYKIVDTAEGVKTLPHVEDKEYKCVLLIYTFL